jgi:hypothetical protein
MGTVSYDGKKIIPAPFVNINKTYSRSEDGHKIGSTFNLTLTGKLLPHRGSPYASGTTPDDAFWTLSGSPPDEDNDGLSDLLLKQEMLRHLFANDGKVFEIQCAEGGTPPMKCYPHVLDVQFAEGPWVQYTDYTITLQAHEMFGMFDSEDYRDDEDFFRNQDGDNLHLESASEDWSLEISEEGERPGIEYSYRLTHNLNAIGKKAYDQNGSVSEGWEQAKNWVGERAGIDNNFIHATSGLNLPAYYQALNHVLTENTNELGGSYAITETWVIASGTVLETMSLSIQDPGQTSTTTVSVDGNIRGLDTKTAKYTSDHHTATNLKYDGALAKWNELTAGGPSHTVFNRAELYAGIPLNPTPKTKTRGINPVAGTISYTFEYDNRPTNFIQDALHEQITIADTKPADVIGRVVVLGRKQGPVLQDLDTRTEYKRALTVTAIMPIYSGFSPSPAFQNQNYDLMSAANMQNMINASPHAKIQPFVDALHSNLEDTYNQVFVESDSSNWNPLTGEYTRNTTWIYQDCILSRTPDPPISGAI